MERLTYFEGGHWWVKIGDTEHSGPIADRLAAYEDTGLEPEDIAAVQEDLGVIPFGRFRNIMEAERDGRLVVLEPEGSMELDQTSKPHKGYKIEGFYCPICAKRHDRIIEIDGVYFTRTEAEAALERREGDWHDD